FVLPSDPIFGLAMEMPERFVTYVLVPHGASVAHYGPWVALLRPPPNFVLLEAWTNWALYQRAPWEQE
ncbi:MAG: hypothetical protein GXO54_01270, partial [Chloroflexi bacterium]|nr:hypothetical protein [Chloroflexota bacterium]